MRKANYDSFPCLQTEVYDLTSTDEHREFLKDTATRVQVPHSTRTVVYRNSKRIGIGVSALGTSRAIALGAYAFALQQIDGKSTPNKL